MSNVKGQSRYFPIEEYETRWQKTWAEIRNRGYETALICGKTGFVYERAMDLIYLSNYHSTQEQEPDTVMWQARSFSAVVFHGNPEPAVHMVRDRRRL